MLGRLFFFGGVRGQTFPTFFFLGTRGPRNHRLGTKGGSDPRVKFELIRCVSV